MIECTHDIIMYLEFRIGFVLRDWLPVVKKQKGVSIRNSYITPVIFGF